MELIRISTLKAPKNIPNCVNSSDHFHLDFELEFLAASTRDLLDERRTPVFCEMKGQVCILHSVKLFQIDGERAV